MLHGILLYCDCHIVCEYYSENIFDKQEIIEAWVYAVGTGDPTPVVLLRNVLWLVQDQTGSQVT